MASDMLAGRHPLPPMEGDIEGAAEALRALMLSGIPDRLAFGTRQDMYSVEVQVQADDLYEAIAKHPMFSDARYWFGLIASAIKDKQRLDAFEVRNRVLDGFVAATWFDNDRLTTYQHQRAGQWVRRAALVPFLSPERRYLYDAICSSAESE